MKYLYLVYLHLLVGVQKMLASIVVILIHHVTCFNHAKMMVVASTMTLFLMDLIACVYLVSLVHNVNLMIDLVNQTLVGIMVCTLPVFH
jgi:hypothetical protein